MFKDTALIKNAAIEAQFFPPVIFFALYGIVDQVCLLKNERFEKQTYRSRCRILGANKVQNLTVPVQKGKSQLISGQVQIIYRSNWQVQHLRTIAAAYGRAPYFDHYFPQVEKLMKAEHSTVYDFNLSTVRWTEKQLRLESARECTMSSEDFEGLNLRSVIHPKHPKEVAVNGVDLSNEAALMPYFQCFDHSGFVPNLSILDLLFNLGPEAPAYLKLK